MKSKNKTAISLIVLVISILVLSILAATVIISLSNTNIMGQASETVFKQDLANYKEAYEMYLTNKLTEDATFDRSTLNITYEDEEYEEILGSVPDKYKEKLKVIEGRLVYDTEDENEKAVVKDLNMKVLKLISKDTSDGASPYIGYFADVDGDDTVDGVIFADLAYSASGQWGSNSSGAFSYSAVAISELKDYEVIEESYSVTGAIGYGSKPVLKAIGSGKDRFYVMSLSNFTTSDYTSFYWYYTLYDRADTSRTSKAFGSGKQNTVNMISDWTADTDSSKSARDMWGVIKQKVYGLSSASDSITGKTESDVEWFVPSIAEWGAFGYAFGLTSSNWRDYGLSVDCWSSSIIDTEWAWVERFPNGYFTNRGITWLSDVRLAATF